MTSPRDKPVSESVPIADLSYTQASRELDEIVSFFEQREVDVDQLVSRLERATAIVDELDRRLRQTRMQVEELVPRLEAVANSRAAVTQTAPDADTGLGGENEGADEDEEDDDDAPEQPEEQDPGRALF